MSEELVLEEEKTAVNEEPVTAEKETIPAEEKSAAPVQEEILATTVGSGKGTPDLRALMKKPLFWEIAVGSAVALVVLIFVIVALAKPVENKPAETETYTPESTAAAAEGPIEPTYLPIDRNPIGPSDFYMEGDYLACLATPSVLGIDVSQHQGTIDWKKVKEAGVEYAMIRVGGRFVDSGKLYKDDFAQANYDGASAVGIEVGAYIYSQAVSVEEAEEEAAYLLEQIKDWDVQMPVVFDWEFYSATARTANMDPRTLTDCTKAFCDKIKEAGYTPMVYFNTNQSLEMLYLVELEEYLFWLAQYDTVLRYDYKIDMWQYTENGIVPGINAPVDINLYFPYEE